MKSSFNVWEHDEWQKERYPNIVEKALNIISDIGYLEGGDGGERKLRQISTVGQSLIRDPHTIRVPWQNLRPLSRR